MTSVPFIALDTFFLIWRLKSGALSKYFSQCFCQSAQATGALLKTFFRWYSLFNFLENITSWARLFKSGLNDFSSISPFTFFLQINSFAEILLSCKAENREVSSTEGLTVDVN